MHLQLESVQRLMNNLVAVAAENRRRIVIVTFFQMCLANAAPQ
jgi:hypothetical protein